MNGKEEGPAQSSDATYMFLSFVSLVFFCLTLDNAGFILFNVTFSLSLFVLMSKTLLSYLKKYLSFCLVSI